MSPRGRRYEPEYFNGPEKRHTRRQLSPGFEDRREKYVLPSEQAPPPDYPRKHHRYPEGGRGPEEQRYLRRSPLRRDPRDVRRHYDTEGESPPPRRSQRQRKPRRHGYDDEDRAHHQGKSSGYHRRYRDPRDEGYFSDSRYDRRNRRRPDRYANEDPDEATKEKGMDSHRDKVEKRKDAPRWQKEAGRMFQEYAVPALKAEGGKLITREIGKFLAK